MFSHAARAAGAHCSMLAHCRLQTRARARARRPHALFADDDPHKLMIGVYFNLNLEQQRQAARSGLVVECTSPVISSLSRPPRNSLWTPNCNIPIAILPSSAQLGTRPSRTHGQAPSDWCTLSSHSLHTPFPTLRHISVSPTHRRRAPPSEWTQRPTVTAVSTTLH